MADLFSASHQACSDVEILDTGIMLLQGFVLNQADTLKTEIDRIATQSPYRQLVTPGGLKMSVSTSSCGELGWHSDEYGYRYVRKDPLTQLPWPAIPDSFLNIARNAAQLCGFNHFNPDACLINRYLPGNKMSLHQDKNERDFSAPIVSISLGLPAIFQFGGMNRSDPVVKLHLHHGDVLVWGGASRLRFHGVLPLAHGSHSIFGNQRINLTFRRAA